MANGKETRKLEGEFKRWVMKKWEDRRWWVAAVEYAMGGDDGFPDLVFMVPNSGRFIPVEVKRAVVEVEERNGLGLVPAWLRSDEIRPSQVIWHRDAWAAGGETYFLWGVERSDGEWDMYGGCGKYVAPWRSGLGIGDDPDATVRLLNGMDELLAMVDGTFVW